MTTVQIDTGSPRDPELAADILRVLGAQPGIEPDRAQRLIEELQGGSKETFDAFLSAHDESGGLLGGAVLLTRREPGDREARPWLVALWVDPEVRGRGLGRKLADVAETHARERGGKELVAVLPPEDDASLFLGERWGFYRERVVVSRSL